VESGIISVRSERQAEDWSVVLLSQGIESTIQSGPQDGQWVLVVDRADYARAVRILRVYITENKRPVWVQPLPWSGGLVFDWRSPVWFVLLAVLFFLSRHGFGALRVLGVVDSGRVAEGEWWRFFTAVMLHGDVPHLVSNCTIGIIFLGLAMAQYGGGVALLGTFVSGAAANVASFFIYREPYRALGASGMVMAALGMLAVHSIWLWQTKRPVGPVVLRSVLGGVLLLVLVGFDPVSDVVAHVSGFVIGGIVGGVVRDRWAGNDAANTIAGLACGALAGLCWWLALR
jgi:membrane associated rhomboid family serine protease